jgi:hypothetical protein
LKILISRFNSIKTLLEENPNMEFVSMDRNPPEWWKGRTISKLVPSKRIIDMIDEIKTRISYQAFDENPEVYGTVMDAYHKDVLSKTTPEKVVSGLKRMFPGTDEFCVLSVEPTHRRSPKTMFKEWFNSSGYSKKTGITVEEHGMGIKKYPSRRKYVRLETATRTDKHS